MYPKSLVTDVREARSCAQRDHSHDQTHTWDTVRIIFLDQFSMRIISEKQPKRETLSMEIIKISYFRTNTNSSQEFW